MKSSEPATDLRTGLPEHQRDKQSYSNRGPVKTTKDTARTMLTSSEARFAAKEKRALPVVDTSNRVCIASFS